MKAVFGFLFTCMTSLAIAQPLPKVATGTLERVSVPSKHIAPRPIDVWLPAGYAEQSRAGQRYQVLYMHDGQNLFDPETTWNKQAWLVDRTLGRLIAEGKVAPTIVVAIPNNGKYRMAEYYPQKFLPLLAEGPRQRYLNERLENRPMADAYLRFLVEELKPLIDARYATLSGPQHTFTMGSSMGGLISVYAMSEYPQVFGGAAGLSTHWMGSGEHNAALPLAAFNYLHKHLPAPGTHKLYQDRGGMELDAMYRPYQDFVDRIARERGYTDADYMSRAFEQEAHNEKAWAARLAIPLEFLLKP